MSNCFPFGLKPFDWKFATKMNPFKEYYFDIKSDIKMT